MIGTRMMSHTKTRSIPNENMALYMSTKSSRTGTSSWRVKGTKRDGTRIRENYADPKDAQCRHIELEGEFLTRETETTLRATRLTDTQVHLAELAFSKLSDDADMPRAVDYWL